MNFDLPIEQLVKRTDTRFQYGFATEAKARLRARDEFVLSASRRGLHVLAPNEDGLAAPVESCAMPMDNAWRWARPPSD